LRRDSEARRETIAQGIGRVVAFGAGLAIGAGFGRDGRPVDAKEACLAEELEPLPGLPKEGLVFRSEEDGVAAGVGFLAEYGDDFGPDVGWGRFWVGMTVSCGARGLSRMACAVGLFASSCLISSYQPRCGSLGARGLELREDGRVERMVTVFSGNFFDFGFLESSSPHKGLVQVAQ